MHTQVAKAPLVRGDEGWMLQFLGHLLSRNRFDGTPWAVAEGPFWACLRSQHFHVFRLNADLVGFLGAVGIREFMENEDERIIEIHLWPYMPALDNQEDEVDVMDPTEVLKLSILLVEGPSGPYVSVVDGFRIRAVSCRMSAGDIHSEVLAYAMKLVSTAQELWPRTLPTRET